MTFRELTMLLQRFDIICRGMILKHQWSLYIKLGTKLESRSLVILSLCLMINCVFNILFITFNLFLITFNVFFLIF